MASGNALALAFALALAATAAPTAAVPPAAGTSTGPAQGLWDLPQGGLDGSVSGALLENGVQRFTLLGQLTAVDTLCLACIQGRFSGALDDGFGPAPDYLVEGTYTGLFLSGSGSFSARILPLGGGPAVGELRGAFRDPPVLPATGLFRGGWRLDG
jgi:hypothetical protein